LLPVVFSAMIFFLAAAALLTGARCAELADAGPRNVVGYFDGGVTLRCDRRNSSAAAGVRWSYEEPGSTLERPVPGRHSYWGSSYGRHGLRLEHLRRSDAGRYICRSAADVPQSFGPASAFVVVVADKPVCRRRATTDYQVRFSFRPVGCSQKLNKAEAIPSSPFPLLSPPSTPLPCPQG